MMPDGSDGALPSFDYIDPCCWPPDLSERCGSLVAQLLQEVAVAHGALPVWLLDVDGVLNASRAGWGGPPRRAQVLADGECWKLHWAVEVVNFVRDAQLRGLAEVRWATTWVPWAATLEALWELPAPAAGLPC